MQLYFPGDRVQIVSSNYGTQVVDYHGKMGTVVPNNVYRQGSWLVHMDDPILPPRWFSGDYLTPIPSHCGADGRS